MKGEGHLLWNHVDIKGTINNTIEHFLYVKSFCDEQKICLNLVRQGQDVFAILPTGSGDREFDFSTLSTNNECNQRKSWHVNFHDHHHCTTRSHNEIPSSSDLEKKPATAIGWGQEEGMDKVTAMWGKCEIINKILWKPRKPKKILFERF